MLYWVFAWELRQVWRRSSQPTQCLATGAVGYDMSVLPGTPSDAQWRWVPRPPQSSGPSRCGRCVVLESVTQAAGPRRCAHLVGQGLAVGSASSGRNPAGRWRSTETPCGSYSATLIRPNSSTSSSSSHNSCTRKLIAELIFEPALPNP